MTTPKTHLLKRLQARFSAYASVATATALLISLPSHAFDLNDAMFNSDTAYSGTQTATVDNNTVVMDVFKEGKKMRMDMNEQGQQISIVVRLDTETNYMLMHQMNMYQEVKSKRIKQYQKDMTMQFSNQQTLGTEQVNGFKCTKYSADFKDNDGNKGTGIYWISDDEIMVRAVMTSKRRRKTTETTMDVTNIKVGDQPDDLFEVPEGYNSMGFGALMGNAMRQSRQNDQPQSDQERARNMPEEQQGESAEDAPVEEGRGNRWRRALKGALGRDNN